MDLPETERPRERLARHGAAGLKDEELLALLLRTGVRGRDALALARDLLARYPGEALARAGWGELSRVPGVGASRAAALLAALELAERLKPGPCLQPVLDSPRRVLDQVAGLRGKKVEHFAALYVDARHRLLAQETVSVGTLTASLVHPREVFAPALAHRAAAAFVVHNHPSGDPAPSAEDREVTRRLSRAGALLGVELLDHLVVADGGFYSFKEQHLL